LRKIIYVVLLLALIAGAVWPLVVQAENGLLADLSLYREEELITVVYPGGQQSSDITRSWIKGVKMRTDAQNGNDVLIIRPDLELVYNINMQRKIYSEMPISLYRQAAKSAMPMLAADSTYRVTGRNKKISKWSCREVIVAEETDQFGQKMKTIWWVSNDVGLEKKILRHIMAITFGTENDAMTMRFFEKLTNIDGYPVQTETSFTLRGQTVKKIQTLKKLEKQEIDNKLFELPEGLTKLNVPIPDGLQPTQ